MKIIKTIVLLTMFSLACRVQAYEGQITVHVADEKGFAVTNAQVTVQFENVLPPGQGWGAGRPNEVVGFTDLNGNSVVNSKSTGGSVSIGVRKDGYYYGSTGIIFTNADLTLNRWLPWNPMVEIVLQKIGVQSPMYARHINGIKIPVEDEPIGFDLMVGDWTAPYGKGQTSDFIFKMERKPEPQVSPRQNPPFDVTLTLGFSNDGDGIQSVFAPPRTSSILRLPRQAPVEGYQPVLVKHQYRELGQSAHIEFREDQNYFFRVRTKKDEKGNILNALYGKITGDFNQEDGGFVVRGNLKFTYYLNPEPNSLNMEFDPKRNLFSNLKFTESVSAP